MKKYRKEKTARIAHTLEQLRKIENNDTLYLISGVILDKVEFYDHCLESWDNPNGKFSEVEIEVGKKCCMAGLDMADAIVNELRIIFL